MNTKMIISGVVALGGAFALVACSDNGEEMSPYAQMLNEIPEADWSRPVDHAIISGDPYVIDLNGLTLRDCYNLGRHWSTANTVRCMGGEDGSEDKIAHFYFAGFPHREEGLQGYSYTPMDAPSRSVP